MDDKIIVSHRGALAAKYGRDGVARVKRAVDALIAADRARGLRSRLVYLDDATAMKRLHAPAVTDAGDPREHKRAIDAIFRAREPAYLMILGSIDVVPHQDVRNPLHAAGDDDDVHAFGDLPYACAAPYSRDAATFKAPSRVVGRLPDLTGAREPSHLLELLDVATRFRSRPAADYARYFGLSTASWRKSTAASLVAVFGHARDLLLAPPKGPRHSAARLARPLHFINCHGALADPAFYGEEDKARNPRQPPSLTSDAVAGKIAPGTVASVECCYGADLYDAVTLALPLPICQRYLAQGAFAWFGSTTIAYGPAEGNGAADLITQYFLQAILQGASVGRATLVARQRYVAEVGELDVVDLKTLAQFIVLGDPSLVPVHVDGATGIPGTTDTTVAKRHMRDARRTKLRQTAAFLAVTKPTAARKTTFERRSPTVAKALAAIAREAKLPRACGFTAFAVTRPPGARAHDAKSLGIASRYFVAVARRAGARSCHGARVVAVAREIDGRIVGYRIYRER